jgi:predicted nuclease of restriction endonuclease-like (RecB) superfamily
MAIAASNRAPLTVKERWGSRHLERQINSGLFEQNLLGKPTLSPAVRALHPLAGAFFKDRYLVDFVDLPEPHTERDLQKALLQHVKAFLLELGRDYCFIGSEYPIQVGRRDFAIDLLFFPSRASSIRAKLEEFYSMVEQDGKDANPEG